MRNEIYSTAWGPLPVSGTLPPAGQHHAHAVLPDAALQVAASEAGDYFIFQELANTQCRVRLYHFAANANDTYTWISDPVIVLRIGHLQSQTFQLPHMKRQLFHQRHCNLLYIPRYEARFSLAAGAALRFMDIVLAKSYLQDLSASYPLLNNFSQKVQRRKPVKLLSHNAIAPLQLLRWQDELLAYGSKVNKDPCRIHYIIDQLLHTGMEALQNTTQPAATPLSAAEANTIYQVAAWLESTHQYLTTEQLADKFQIPLHTLQQGFTTIFGYPLTHHRFEEQMRKALQLVNDKSYTGKKLARVLGYREAQSFTRAFQHRFGYMPWRNAAR